MGANTSLVGVCRQQFLVLDSENLYLHDTNSKVTKHLRFFKMDDYPALKNIEFGNDMIFIHAGEEVFVSKSLSFSDSKKPNIEKYRDGIIIMSACETHIGTISKTGDLMLRGLQPEHPFWGQIDKKIDLFSEDPKTYLDVKCGVERTTIQVADEVINLIAIGEDGKSTNIVMPPGKTLVELYSSGFIVEEEDHGLIIDDGTKLIKPKPKIKNASFARKSWCYVDDNDKITYVYHKGNEKMKFSTAGDRTHNVPVIDLVCGNDFMVVAYVDGKIRVNRDGTFYDLDLE